MLRQRGSVAGRVRAPPTATWVGPRRDLRRTSPRAPRPTLVIVLSRVHSWLDRHPAAGDAGVAVVLLLFCLSTFVGGQQGAGAVDLVFTVLLCAPLAVRRRAPVATFAAVMVLCAAELLLVDSFLAANVAALVALYTLVVYAPRPLAAAGVCVALAGTVPFALHFDDLSTSSETLDLGRADRASPAGGAARRPDARGARAAGCRCGVRGARTDRARAARRHRALALRRDRAGRRRPLRRRARPRRRDRGPAHDRAKRPGRAGRDAARAGSPRARSPARHGSLSPARRARARWSSVRARPASPLSLRRARATRAPLAPAVGMTRLPGRPGGADQRAQARRARRRARRPAALGAAPASTLVVRDDGAARPARRRPGPGLRACASASSCAAARSRAGPRPDGGFEVRGDDPASVIRAFFLVDDQALVRAGFRLRDRLPARPGRRGGGRRRARGAGRARPSLRADVVLMDVRMPVPRRRGRHRAAARARGDARAARDRAHHVRPRRVRLRGDPRGRQRLPAQGRRPEELLAAIRTVPRGDAVVAPSATRRLLEHVADRLPGHGRRTRAWRR